MPSVLFERFPMPNLKIYSSVSVLALSACIYYAVQNIKNPKNLIETETGNLHRPNLNNTNTSDYSGRSVTQFLSEVFYLMMRENVCTWTMINMAFCWLILVGRAVQKLVFGELRVSEQQHLKDKFWNFIFYKFIFVFGVINVQYIDEVLLWCSWFAVLGFLHLLSQLCTDRFEYLSFSPTTPIWNHVKLMCLLAGIFMLACFMFLVSVFVGFFGGIHTFAFMSAEVIHLGVRTLHTIIRYGLHLYDLRQEGTAAPPAGVEENKVWERRGTVAYYTEICFELAALIIDFLHHIHMLFWSNIFLSMASLVICMQMRFLFYEIQRKYKKHRNYLWVRNHLEQNYPMATTEELSENSDNCAICWEKMDAARKLPCSHLFHNTCLLSWLEQDTSCPTCRMTLNIQSPPTRRETGELPTETTQPARRQLSFFHFDGSRYVSWFPSFSVEINHNLQRQETAAATNSQLDAMARQVQTLFPHLPQSIVIDDLRVTRSVELTVENVLDGRIVAPTLFREPESYSGGQTFSIAPAEEAGPSGSWDELTSSDNTENEDASNMGSRFSKSSSEREKILLRRKEKLIQNARKRYIERQRAAATLQAIQS